MQIKVALDDGTCKVCKFDGRPDLVSLREALLCKIPSSRDHRICYTDSDGDLVEIDDDSVLLDALASCQQTALKITLRPATTPASPPRPICERSLDRVGSLDRVKWDSSETYTEVDCDKVFVPSHAFTPPIGLSLERVLLDTHGSYEGGEIFKALHAQGIKTRSDAAAMAENCLRPGELNTPHLRRFLMEVLGADWKANVASDRDQKRWCGIPSYQHTCGWPASKPAGSPSSLMEESRLIRMCKALGLSSKLERLGDHGVFEVGTLHFYWCEADLIDIGFSMEDSRALLHAAAAECFKILFHEGWITSIPIIEHVSADVAQDRENNATPDVANPEGGAESPHGSTHASSEQGGAQKRRKLDEGALPCEWLESYEKLRIWLQNPDHGRRYPARSSKDPAEKTLANFCMTQKADYNNGAKCMTQARVDKLNDLPGWSFSKREADWYKSCDAVKDWLDRHKNTYPSLKSADEAEKKLARWVKENRSYDLSSFDAHQRARLKLLKGWS